jgi:selenocysteine lyase/cysteine desulfurase
MVARETGAKVRYIPVDAKGYLDTSALDAAKANQDRNFFHVNVLVRYARKGI